MKKRMIVICTLMCASSLFSMVVAEETFSQQAEEVLEPARINGPHWPRVAPALRIATQDALDRMGSTDPQQRVKASRDLIALGRPVLPLLVEGLYYQNPLVRTTCATQLGDIGGLSTVKYLIEAFYAAMPVDGEAATYQRTFIRGLKEALEKVTGQAFIRVEARSPLMQNGLREYIHWYNENLDRLPNQLGEAEVSPIDPAYLMKIRVLRELVLKKSEWERPPLSVEYAIGESTTPEGVRWSVERPADTQFYRAIPTIPRNGGFFRQTDRKWAESLLRHGSKEPAQ